ncbi:MULTISPECIES: pyruvate, phosphate dikinase [Methylosinus]|uniref:Pyruvate, phosphate dikinase n=1 Tax=Methylosinus trichosporium (strain ATCC 35070 / NCIMB 11131 / UNIQEM 75 / OB3b) TaxID=595536 RepID=A0A2D2CWX3_METT3|nr:MULTISPECIES: pyruvate, phosphate dikinase [Methylosinus]ATQ67240.1 pyruvate, phosphate dikinase [Methylosinus trichosporium OB3b]OBS52560.1 pyruvate, phosphate dikinase [Methylosinus sp. 3S-1]
MTKWVYHFGAGAADGSAALRDLLGGKGANLAEMAALGLPVPPGFTITTEVCTHFYANGKTYPADLEAEVEAALTRLGEIAGHAFGETNWPLLVSVRSGARASMPGMMDTVLNLGLNDETVEALAKIARNERFAYDSYRRFIEMYSTVVLGLEHHEFEDALEAYKAARGQTLDTELTAEDWRKVAALFKEIVEKATSRPFPQDARQQLWGAIGAVFSSWMNARAIIYRQLHNIPENWGTAVTVQAMVFGNMDDQSATGVAFTRNPSTGARELYGEFLINAQGEDVVAGIRTPQSITEAARRAGGSERPSMEAALPQIFAEFRAIAQRLETHYRDMQDMEFTVERGRLWMLQTRAGKRTGPAALKIAVDLATEGLISREEAILRIDPLSLDQLLHPTIDPDAKPAILASGLPASPGAAAGEIVFDAAEAEKLAAAGRKVILVRVETSPEDIGGMHAAEGILTTRGGMTSHAAVVARGMGKPCVCGVGAIRVNYEEQSFSVAGRRFSKGDLITIDGSAGRVIAGAVTMRQPELTGEFAVLMGWADKARRMRVRANAETAADTRAARRFGAEGVGLARTEHMFFEGERIVAVREMILADDAAGRRAALAKLLPMQRADFQELFEIMSGLPVTIRLLDPPLHEFLPHSDTEIAEVARAMGADPAKLRQRARELSEFNPMLGFRGVRLAVAFPEIVEMQARAILEAAIAAAAVTGVAATVEIMVPLVFGRPELDFVRAQVAATAAAVTEETGLTPSYKVGTMIELPRACLRAGEIAQTAEFFSFGTNDLTQTALGVSRDDAGAFLGVYSQKGILPADPFVTIDQEGVGELVRLAATRARAERPGIKLGICGEHGGDPASIAFFESVGLDYISCSPFRVPIARLAAAQAALGKTATSTA